MHLEADGNVHSLNWPGCGCKRQGLQKFPALVSLEFFFCALFVQVWWHVAGAYYWKHPRGKGLERQDGSSNGRIPRFMCSSCPPTWCLRLGRVMGKSKDHVSHFIPILFNFTCIIYDIEYICVTATMAMTKIHFMNLSLTICRLL